MDEEQYGDSSLGSEVSFGYSFAPEFEERLGGGEDDGAEDDACDSEEGDASEDG